MNMSNLENISYDSISNEEKIKLIQKHFKIIMEILGMDVNNDDSLIKTPDRIAKMFVNEIFCGLDKKNEPSITTIKNKWKYNQMIIEKNVTINSTCEHHFLPISGVAHIGYISNGSIIGLSKINRIAQYYSKKPQVQERLTSQIVEAMKKALKIEDVACIINAKHLCVSSRGIQDSSSTTITSEFSGKFQQDKYKNEFLEHIK